MNRKLSRLSTAVLIGAGVFLLAAGLWTGLQRRYQATARIQVIGDTKHSEARWLGKEPPAELLMHITEISSSLDAVVKSLPQSGELAGLSPAQAVTKLQRNVRVNAVPGTSMIEIKVSSRDPAVAALFANQIATISGTHARRRVVESATAPTHRGFPDFMPAMKMLAPAVFLLGAGLFILRDQRRALHIQPA